MATTYSGLQSEIVKWRIKTGDADFLAEVPGFIYDAEKRMSVEVNLRENEKTATAPLTDSRGYCDLPDDFKEMRSCCLKDSTGNIFAVLTYISPHMYAQKMSNSHATGQPQFFMIVGNQMRFFPIQDTAATYSIELVYYGNIPALSDTNTTNTTLLAYPQLYRFACLVEAAVWEGDDEAMAKYENNFQKALAVIKEARYRAEEPNGALIQSDNIY